MINLLVGVLLQVTAGYYSAPNNATSSTVTAVIQNSPIKTISQVKTLTDTAVSMLIFGGWAGRFSGSVFSMGPNAGRGGTIGPWTDTLFYARLYKKYPPDYVIGNPVHFVRQDNWADTTVLVGYKNDGVTFSFSRPGVLEFVKDSAHSIFRVINDNLQEVFIVARYAGLVDSMKVVTVPDAYCRPWPDCYYNPPRTVIPELPRIYLDDMVAEARAAFSVPPTDTIVFLEDLQMMCCGECKDTTQNYAPCQRNGPIVPPLPAFSILPKNSTYPISRVINDNLKIVAPELPQLNPISYVHTRLYYKPWWTHIEATCVAKCELPMSPPKNCYDEPRSLTPGPINCVWRLELRTR